MAGTLKRIGIVNEERRLRISTTLKGKLTEPERERLSIIGKAGAKSRWSKEN